jgi:hypothetical protein
MNFSKNSTGCSVVLPIIKFKKRKKEMKRN